MKKSKFSLAKHKAEFLELIKKIDHKTLALWAIDCAERVMPYFEEKFPEDPRPRNAIDTLQAWNDTGVFKMAVIRKASLSSHAAARDVGDDNARLVLPPVPQVRPWQRLMFPLTRLALPFMLYKLSIESRTLLMPILL